MFEYLDFCTQVGQMTDNVEVLHQSKGWRLSEFFGVCAGQPQACLDGTVDRTMTIKHRILGEISEGNDTCIETGER